MLQAQGCNGYIRDAKCGQHHGLPGLSVVVKLVEQTAQSSRSRCGLSGLAEKSIQDVAVLLLADGGPGGA